MQCGYRMGHTNPVGTEWVTQIQWVQNGSHKCSGYRMGHTNAVGTEWVTQMQWVQNGSHKCSGYEIMGHTWVTEDALIHGKFCMLLSSAVVVFKSTF